MRGTKISFSRYLITLCVLHIIRINILNFLNMKSDNVCIVYNIICKLHLSYCTNIMPMYNVRNMVYVVYGLRRTMYNVIL